LKGFTMLNEAYDAIEEVMESLDAGGEQSREFAQEIATLKEVLGYPKPPQDLWDQLKRKKMITRKLRRLAIEAKGLTASLPTLSVEKWLDGTVADATVDVCFEECDLAKLLQFIADIGVSQEC
jgi:hypothetical protein